MKTTLRTVAVAGALTATGLGVLAPAAFAAASGDTTVTAAVSDRVSHLEDALKGLVTDGTLTQAQADKVARTLASSLPDRGPGGPGGPRGGGPLLAEAAKVLGTTEDALRTQLQSGTTLAAVAKAKGISVDTLVAELVAAAKAHLAAEVKAGTHTQAEADARLAGLQQRITDMVNSTGPMGRHGFGGPGAPPTATS